RYGNSTTKHRKLIVFWWILDEKDYQRYYQEGDPWSIFGDDPVVDSLELGSAKLTSPDVDCAEPGSLATGLTKG
ncbi:hypothetical protein Tco_0301937, partial [Tanacetum coccineum]